MNENTSLISTTDGQGRPRPDRLLMTADSLGGVWDYALELARGLLAAGVHVTVAVMGAPLSAAQAREAAALDGLDLREGQYRLEWMDEPWEDVRRAGDWLLEIAEVAQPDVVHLNGYAHAALAWRAPVVVIAHSCVFSWWHAVRGEAPPACWARYWRAVRRGLRSADLVIAPSRAMLAALGRHYGEVARGRVIPNGRDAARFGRAHKEPFILSAGRLWDEAKNIKALDEAAGGLAWPVYVAGQQRSPGGRQAEALNLCPLGHLASEEMAGWLSRAAVFALPARYEPFGLSVLEAGLSECALVLGDIDSLRENWDGAAHFVPPEDPEALRSALARLIGDATQRKGLAARARFRARELTPRRMVDAYLEAYAEVLAARRRPPLRKGASPCAS